tara:strand:+ start:439 stop:702 length:264 start_codon:yes stop_codon:yes gene_type:complete
MKNIFLEKYIDGLNYGRETKLNLNKNHKEIYFSFKEDMKNLSNFNEDTTKFLHLVKKDWNEWLEWKVETLTREYKEEKLFCINNYII